MTLAGAVGILAIIGTVIISSVTGVSLSDITRDVVAVTDTHLYVGALSTTGLMLWAAASGICLVSAAALIGLPQCRGAVQFLLYAGILSALLGLDDAFLLHERVFPNSPWLKPFFG